MVAMITGFAIASAFAVRALVHKRGGKAAFQILRTMMGSAILLGLEILVAADLIRTVMNPSLNEVIILGIIVIIRTVRSVSIQIEIEGVLPWKRALLKSGGQIMAETAAQEVAKSAPSDDSHDGTPQH